MSVPDLPAVPADTVRTLIAEIFRTFVDVPDYPPIPRDRAIILASKIAAAVLETHDPTVAILYDQVARMRDAKGQITGRSE